MRVTAPHRLRKRCLQRHVDVRPVPSLDWTCAAVLLTRSVFDVALPSTMRDTEPSLLFGVSTGAVSWCLGCEIPTFVLVDYASCTSNASLVGISKQKP